MPYVNIPRSKITGGIAKIVGKLQGDISNKIVTQTSNITSNFRRQGCPSPGKLARLRNQKQGLDQGISGAVNRINKFKALPSKLTSPLNGLKSALKIILAIPIPQAVPPGIGIPVNITTKFADVLHLIKEFIAQIGEDIEGIEAILETPNNFLSSIERIMGRLDGALKACETEAALRTQVENGTISENDLRDLDIIDDEGTYIFSTLGPLFVGNLTIDANGNTVNIDGSSIVGNQTDINGSESDNKFNEANQKLQDILNRIEFSNLPQNTKDELRKSLNLFQNLNTQTQSTDSRFFHTGPTGILYNLEIIPDPESPSIAPRNFAIAREPGGAVVLKGPKSFSSSIDVLLNEIKFRIDNQLS